jgi:hypothetical protein
MTSNHQCECQDGNHGHKPDECENVAMEGHRLCKDCNDLSAQAMSGANQPMSQPVTNRALSEAVRSTTGEKK